MKTARPNCYECVHRRDLPGDAHSSCAHPAFANVAAESPLAQLLSLLGERAPIQAEGITVRGNPYGIRQGWFQHPINFDPGWLQECSGFTGKSPDNETVK